MPYATRSGISHASREEAVDDGDGNAANGDHGSNAISTKPGASVDTGPPWSIGPPFQMYHGPTPKIHPYFGDSDAAGYFAIPASPEPPAKNEGEATKMKTNNHDKYESDSDASQKEDDEETLLVEDEHEVEHLDHDLALLSGIEEVLTRVNETLAKEERCWYELESPHCRNRRQPFILKVELDVLECVKNKQMKEMVEILAEMASHYKDALSRIEVLKDEVNNLTERFQPEECNDDGPLADEVKSLDAKMEVDNDKENRSPLDMHSVAESINDDILMG